MELVQHRWVGPSELNAHGNLFGGKLLSWVDEDSSMCAHNLIANPSSPDIKLTTVGFDHFAFKTPAGLGDRIVFKYNVIGMGNSSVVVKAVVTNFATNDLVAYGFVTLCCIDKDGKPTPHGHKQFTDDLVDFFKEKRVQLSRLVKLHRDNI